MTTESRLIPVLRDGVNIIKMVFFKELKPLLTEKYPEQDRRFIGMLTGAAVNDLFGTPNDAPPYAGFVATNGAVIREVLESVASAFENLKIPLTDALRVQFLCDDLEGIGNPDLLPQARSLGILMVDRPVPLPKTFMQLSRRLGAAYHILDPETAPD